MAASFGFGVLDGDLAGSRRLRSARDSYQPLLGTRVEVELAVTGRDNLALARATAVAERERLEAVFTTFDESSELQRWVRGERDEPGEELATVLSLANKIQRATGGAFSPATKNLLERWRQAEHDGRSPDSTELEALVLESATSRDVSLNAIAKGFIVDQTVLKVLALPGVDTATVNAGGDLVHRGPTAKLVGIEDPRWPFDNVPPMVQISLANAALATSGTGRRGFVVGGVTCRHVIDPRTGIPVDHVLSASVVAPDAVTADALATAAMVLAPEESVLLADEFQDVGVFILAADGQQYRNDYWRSRER